MNFHPPPMKIIIPIIIEAVIPVLSSIFFLYEKYMNTNIKNNNIIYSDILLTEFIKLLINDNSFSPQIFVNISSKSSSFGILDMANIIFSRFARSIANSSTSFGP